MTGLNTEASHICLSFLKSKSLKIKSVSVFKNAVSHKYYQYINYVSLNITEHYIVFTF